MAQNHKDAEVKNQSAPQPLTLQNAQLAIYQAGSSGRITITSHLKMRGSQRRFTTVEALNVVRTGKLEDRPEYCCNYGNWKYRMYGKHDYGYLWIVVALGFDDEDCKRSRIILVTGYVRREYENC